MKNKAFQITTVLLIIGLFVFVGFSLPKEQPRGFVVSSKLYQEFTMKKELEDNLMAKQTAWNNELDSLKIQLEFKAQTYKSLGEENIPMLQELQMLDRQLTQKTQQYEELNQQETQRALEQIWNQLNTYIEAYGEANGYEYIYGANGDGAIMYADAEHELTDEIIEYVNKQYAGR